MKIESSKVAMHSEHELKHKTSMSFESLLHRRDPSPSVKKEPLQEERALLAQFHFALIRQLLEMLQGCGCRRKELFTLDKELQNKENSAERGAEETAITRTTSVSEKLEVSMKGEVKSDKGAVNLDIFLSISRSVVRSAQLSAEDFIDPLVISFTGELPRLGSTTFHFDIDSDGEKDQVSRLAEGNGFLALDKNGNGSIDGGSELFGAFTGNGFAELAEYDRDNNCWIDANDPIMEKLRIWMVNDNEERLVSVSEAGVGAIFLGQTASPFILADGADQILGRIRSSGLYLSEEMRAGAVAQLDLRKLGTQRTSEKGAEPLAQALMAV